MNPGQALGLACIVVGCVGFVATLVNFYDPFRHDGWGY